MREGGLNERKYHRYGKVNKYFLSREAKDGLELIAGNRLQMNLLCKVPSSRYNTLLSLPERSFISH